jgi:thiamine biosynthesis protein ThiS
MEIVLNGQPREIELNPKAATVDALTAALGMKADRVAVERNGEIVRRTDWAATPVHSGDRFEIVHFVGGGR